ncbi:ATP-binding cassette domain-containing protein [Heliobacterium gestii]|uniref:ATP-binding cassette domain-containing protein n=1 Tax=Heliomicrobium gestii TaxID=2699 RepID=A0A845LG61_HELGE|nr:ATP-binding cassette domain-containing protein [Heliomicrobium gestii]MBM7865596.1 D-methionine transport system ATP-binding protein [Heliomicrobium gestii]MZP41846.1 ATP-binding cassette domain-containing protein [Heliomicrobium gestii]
MLEVKHLRKTYLTQQGAVEALKDVSFRVEQGDILGIIGLSGAGKSTLIRCLNRLEEPDAGEILLRDHDVMAMKGKTLRQTRMKIGMIFQHFHLFDARTVWKNVAFPLEVARLSKDVIEKRVKTLLDLVGLTEKRDAYPSQLSGGQKQRVGIARALAMEPELLLCDEATSSLDPLTTRSILELLQDINLRLGVTIVLITHEMDVVRQICRHVAVLEDGRVIEAGTPDEVFRKPRSATLRHFLQHREVSRCAG